MRACKTSTSAYFFHNGFSGLLLFLVSFPSLYSLPTHFFNTPHQHTALTHPPPLSPQHSSKSIRISHSHSLFLKTSFSRKCHNITSSPSLKPLFLLVFLLAHSLPSLQSKPHILFSFFFFFFPSHSVSFSFVRSFADHHHQLPFAPDPHPTHFLIQSVLALPVSFPFLLFPPRS